LVEKLWSEIEESMVREKIQVQEMIRFYRDLVITHRDASMASDYKKANKLYHKLTKLYKIFKQNDLLAEEILNILIHDDDIRVRLWAAAHCLGLNKFVNEAENTLKEIALCTEYNTLGMEADMTLKVWKEKGYLRF
jgi:hypothetical protein